MLIIMAVLYMLQAILQVTINKHLVLTLGTMLLRER